MQSLPILHGFRSHKIKAENVQTGQLAAFSGKVVDSTVLAKAKLISNAYVVVKLIVKGDVAKNITVKLPGASQSAIAALEAAGGSYEKTERLPRPVTTTKQKD